MKNPKKLIYGRLPGFGLDKRGLVQVEKLAEAFKSIKLDIAYISPLLRSRQTVKALKEYQPKLKIRKSDDLLEVDNKIWEGKVWTERDPELVKIYKNTPTKLKVKGLESVFDVEKRVARVIDKIIKEYKDKGGHIAIISHADPIRIATLHYKKESLDSLHEKMCTNASINTLVFNGGKLVKSDYREIYPRADESYWTKTNKQLA